jgi:SSS family solute:Na+ symporter
MCAVAAYVGVSLYSSLALKHPTFEMDRLLHRGKYALTGDHADFALPATGWRALLPTKEFTLGDKCIYYGNLTWTVAWFGIFLFATIFLRNNTSEDSWATFWWVKVVLTIVLGVATTIWFLIGGIHDIRDLFKTLATLKRDHTDDGRVAHGPEVSEETLADIDEAATEGAALGGTALEQGGTGERPSLR